MCSSTVFPVLLCSAQFLDLSADPDQWLEELQIGAEFVGSNTRGSIGRRPERAVARQPHQVEMLRECIAKYCQKYGNLLGFSNPLHLPLFLFACLCILKPSIFTQTLWVLCISLHLIPYPMHPIQHIQSFNPTCSRRLLAGLGLFNAIKQHAKFTRQWYCCDLNSIAGLQHDMALVKV